MVCIHIVQGGQVQYESCLTKTAERGRNRQKHTNKDFTTTDGPLDGLISIFSEQPPFQPTMSLRSRPLDFQNFTVTFPQDKVVQVTLTRTEKLNCVDRATSRQIAEIWEEFDQDGSLLVGIITGEGRAFCTGADLQGAIRAAECHPPVCEAS